MGNISSNSMAAGVGAGVQNTVFMGEASVLSRKYLLIATQNPAYADCAPIGKPFLVTSPGDVAGRSGWGSMAHRLALAAFRGTKNSVPVYLLLQGEADTAQAATGQIIINVEASHGEGILALYVAGKPYKIPVLASDDHATTAERIAIALGRDLSCPVTATHGSGSVMLTAKSKGPWGNGITIAVNQREAEDEALPPGYSCSIIAMGGGSGVPDLAEGLEKGLGSGDSANENFYTDIAHGYGKDTQALNALSKYVGEGNEFSGLYSRTVARPFRSLVGDVSTGSAGLQALIDFTKTRKADRCNGICVKPGSLTHPQEIAAELLGVAAAIANDMAEGSYIDLVLSGVDPGIVARESGQDWTTEYTNRDLAVKAGVSPLIVKGGAVYSTDVVSFYQTDDPDDPSNMYRRVRNISVTQNVLYNLVKNFSSAKWKGFTVVKDKANVTESRDQAKARDADDVKDDDLALINSFMRKGWLYDTEYSIKKLKEPTAVQVRTDGGGFNNNLSLIYSGEGGILDTVCYVDTSIAITKAA